MLEVGVILSEHRLDVVSEVLPLVVTTGDNAEHGFNASCDIHRTVPVLSASIDTNDFFLENHSTIFPALSVRAKHRLFQRP